MSNITIPPAALEAGKLVLLRGIYGDDQMPCAELARAAFLAMLENWPGIAWQQGGNGTERPLLPLPAEASDDQ